MLGVHAGVTRRFAKSVHNYIVASRIAQGQADLSESTREEREDIIVRWRNLNFELKNFYALKRKEQTAGKAPEVSNPAETSESGFSRPTTSWLRARQMSAEDRKKLKAQKEAWKKRIVQTAIGNTQSSSSLTASPEDAEFEQAIQASVRETSRGNAQEDAIVEQAIRESVLAIREKGGLPEAIAGPHGKDLASIFDDDEYKITDEEYQALIEQAIQQSMSNNFPGIRLPHDDGIMELDSSDRGLPNIGASAAGVAGSDEDDIYEDDLKRALLESESASHQQNPPATDLDSDLQRAIEESRAEMERAKNERTEEEIVLEYVRKQSLAEEEFRRQAAKAKGNEIAEDEDEELKRAMEESLRMSRKDDSGPSGSRDI
jgi:hypothetical protein